MTRCPIIGVVTAACAVAFTLPAIGAPAEGISELEQGYLQKAA